MRRRDEPVNGEAFKRLLQQLGTTIERTLSESPQISDCLDRMRAEGYEVSLEFDATIGLSRMGRDAPEETRLLVSPEVAAIEPARMTSGPLEMARSDQAPIEETEPVPLKMTPLDRKFLRSLKIAVDD
jgi:hypothetical protein